MEIKCVSIKRLERTRTFFQQLAVQATYHDMAVIKCRSRSYKTEINKLLPWKCTTCQVDIRVSYIFFMSQTEAYFSLSSISVTAVATTGNKSKSLAQVKSHIKLAVLIRIWAFLSPSYSAILSDVHKNREMETLRERHALQTTHAFAHHARQSESGITLLKVLSDRNVH